MSSVSTGGKAEHPGAVWLNFHYGELPTGEWVAATKAGLVAHDSTQEQLYAKLHALGLNLEEVAVAFIQETGPALKK